MPEGCIEPAQLEFLTYRIVDLSLRSPEQLLIPPEILQDESRWQMGVGLPDIAYDTENQIYLVPVMGKYDLMPEKGDGENPQDPILTVEGVIIGTFRLSDGEETGNGNKDRLLMNQTCAILSPYLRAAFSTLLAAAGYGAAPMPLINMARLAESIDRKIVPIENPEK